MFNLSLNYTEAKIKVDATCVQFGGFLKLLKIRIYIALFQDGNVKFIFELYRDQDNFVAHTRYHNAIPTDLVPLISFFNGS